MLCKPKNPACDICPVRVGCVALATDTISALPVKIKTSKIKHRFFNYLLIRDGDYILMNKRGEKDIWANMYDLPLVETAGPLMPEQVINSSQLGPYFESDIIIVKTYPVKKHVLTHQHLYTQFIHIANKPVKLKESWRFVPLKDLQGLAQPKIIDAFINSLQ